MTKILKIENIFISVITDAIKKVFYVNVLFLLLTLAFNNFNYHS